MGGVGSEVEFEKLKVWQLIISKELGYLSQNDYDLLRTKAERITNYQL